MDFDFRQLEIFCHVVEQRSFTRAARAVHLSQASVSERIASLERTVGVRLLDRLGREVVPTAVGRRLFAGATALLDGRRELQRDLEGLTGIERGALELGASTIPGEYLLPATIARFRQRYPDVVFRVAIAATDGIIDRVARGELEIGVVGSRREVRHLAFTPLWHDELVLVVPADHPLAGRGELAPAELAGVPLIQRQRGSGTRRTWEERVTGELGEAAPRAVAELGSTAAVKAGVLAGMGGAVLSVRAVATELAAGLVATLRIAGVDLRRRFHLVADERRARSPLCERFVDALLADAEGDPAASLLCGRP